MAKTVTASDRVDDFVRPWMTRARCMEVTFDELGVIPRPFIKLDRILQESIKEILNKKDEVHRTLVHESRQRSDQRLQPLTGLQMLRRLYLSFATNNTLTRFSRQADMSKANMVGRWSPHPHLHALHGGLVGRRRLHSRAETRCCCHSHARFQRHLPTVRSRRVPKSRRFDAHGA